MVKTEIEKKETKETKTENAVDAQQSPSVSQEIPFTAEQIEGRSALNSGANTAFLDHARKMHAPVILEPLPFSGPQELEELLRGPFAKEREPLSLVKKESGVLSSSEISAQERIPNTLTRDQCEIRVLNSVQGVESIIVTVGKTNIGGRLPPGKYSPAVIVDPGNRPFAVACATTQELLLAGSLKLVAEKSYTFVLSGSKGGEVKGEVFY